MCFVYDSCLLYVEFFYKHILIYSKKFNKYGMDMVSWFLTCKQIQEIFNKDVKFVDWLIPHAKIKALSLYTVTRALHRCTKQAPWKTSSTSPPFPCVYPALHTSNRPPNPHCIFLHIKTHLWTCVAIQKSNQKH